MPELPEVETIARGVDDKVRGETIAQCWFGAFPKLYKTPAEDQAAGLEGRKILEVHRTGKHIVFELGRQAVRTGRASQPSATPDAQWIVHLGMTGRLLVTSPDSPLPPHTHARLLLAGGREVRFVDPRRFGRLEFRDFADAQGFIAPGSEPLSISAAEFAALFKGRKLPIKAALLNQKLLSGVGNIYADESLFRAGIRPRKPAGRLTRAELERLRTALCQVLRHAIRLGGSSVADYVDADGERGLFQLKHRVYLRTGQPCLTCQTPIRRIVLAGRGTHFCPRCQR